MLFGEEEHHAEVADAFFGEVGGGDEFHAFELTEVGGVACSYVACIILYKERLAIDNFTKIF